MPNRWKRLSEYSRSGLNKLKRKRQLLEYTNDDSDEAESQNGNMSNDETANNPEEESADNSCDSSVYEYEFRSRSTDNNLAIETSDDSSANFSSSKPDDSNDEQNSLGIDNIESRSVNSATSSETNSEGPQWKNEPLYDGAPVTIAEAHVAAHALMSRHNMNSAAKSDLLKYTALICPPRHKFPSSLYKFKKQFSEFESPLSRHFYCSRCLITIEEKQTACTKCGHGTNITYFLHACLISQIKALFNRSGFWDMLQYRHNQRRENPNNYNDIYEGSVYKELTGNGNFLDNTANITFTLYTDGIRIFKSSRFNIWPIYFVINELPFAERMRKENILTASLWFGDEKPSPNLFLAPLVETMRQLRAGIEIHIPNYANPLTIKGIIICCTCAHMEIFIFKEHAKIHCH